MTNPTVAHDLASTNSHATDMARRLASAMQADAAAGDADPMAGKFGLHVNALLGEISGRERDVIAAHNLSLQFQEYFYRVSGHIPFELAGWAHERGAALLEQINSMSVAAISAADVAPAASLTTYAIWFDNGVKSGWVKDKYGFPELMDEAVAMRDCPNTEHYKVRKLLINAIDVTDGPTVIAGPTSAGQQGSGDAADSTDSQSDPEAIYQVQAVGAESDAWIDTCIAEYRAKVADGKHLTRVVRRAGIDAFGEVKPPFLVEVSKMKESHRETFWVRLTNTALRPANPRPFDETGTITPFMTEEQEHAQHVAKEWAEFLGVPHQIECNCIMCDIPRRKKTRTTERNV
jgi:hypothetical protein